jgi:hypothetical protein
MHDLFATSFGTTNLLKLLESVLRSLDWLNHVDRPEPEGTELLVQIRDLHDATSVLDDLATRGRRKIGPSKSVPVTPSDMVHLQKLWGGVATITQECSESVDTLQSRLKDVALEKNSQHYVFREIRLGDKVWYDETYQTLKLHTEALQILISAINLIHHKDEFDNDGNLSGEALSLSSKLQYQIAILGPKLDDKYGNSTTEVCPTL